LYTPEENGRESSMIDLLIKNGTVVDGSGKEEFKTDIAIQGDKIEEIGNLGEVEAHTIIEASGLFVTPGFIDSHSHSDEAYLVNPLSESKLRQGITTEIVGNCGFSPFPLNEEIKKRYQKDYEDWGIDIDWNSAEEYLQRVEEAKPAVNIIPLVGQGTIRACVIGYDDRNPSEDEMQKMKDLLRDSIKAGCWGYSTGLIYPPGCFSKTEELIELARAMKDLDGIYTSHIRSEGDELLESIEEAIRIGRESDCLVEIAHLKAAGVKNWGKGEEAINMIMQAREEGVRVGFDRYPYTASSTGLSSLLPDWAHAGGRKKTVEYITDPDTSEKMIDEMQNNLEGQNGWSSIILAHAGCDEYAKFEGLSISEIANIKDISPPILVFYILLKSKFSASICAFTMSRPETEMIMTHPSCAVCTDATARAMSGPLSKGKPHPRAFGAFPKFFRNYVKEKQAISLAKAVAKTSHLPAKRFGIKGRGMIAKGYFADILLIDWSTFTDTATYENPISLSQGLEAVIVNGEIVYMDGKYTNNRPGRVLSRV
jgi:N-acyl-D-amino-acid deacylase